MTGFLWSDDADAFFGESEAGAGSSPQKKTPRKKPGDSQESPLTVSQLSDWIKRTLDQAISTFWLAGEIGSLTQSSAGHVYLTLKDSGSQISAVIWRSTFERIGMDLSEGMAVLVQGRIDVYPPRGAYQLIIQRMEQQGLGALQAAFRALHRKLLAEGLFAEERKKTLPRFPMRIGFVTSPSGAAIHDFTQVLKRRWPAASILVIPARVQGEGSVDDIVKGIRVAAKIVPKLDVLVVGRGGGSIEDLWSFNEELVVRAVAQCPIPTISAVGHEVDVTLCDLAADIRALTPSEAAEIVAPNQEEFVESLQGIKRRADSLMALCLQRSQSRLTNVLGRSPLQEPERILERPSQRIDEAYQDLDLALDKKLDLTSQMLHRSAQVLEALSPLRTLARGYSLTTKYPTGELVSTIDAVQLGERIDVRLEDGIIAASVQSISPAEPKASGSKRR